jgi:hypothetical protein
MQQRIAAVGGCLARHAAKAGWTIADHSSPARGDGDGIVLLEYQATAADGRRLRLDLCGFPERQAITAELWSPDDLHAAASEGAGLPLIEAVRAVAIHRRSWPCDPDADVRDIGRELAGWLAGVLPPA